MSTSKFSDQKLVNFSEKHELDYVLKKSKKPQTQENRSILKEIGKECKEKLGKRTITHEELEKHLKKKAKKLLDKK